MTASQQAYGAAALQQMDASAAIEDGLMAARAAAADAADAEAAAAAAEAAKFRKDPEAPSLHGGFEARRLEMLTVGGETNFASSTVAHAIGPAPPLPEPRPPSEQPSEPAEAHATGEAEVPPLPPVADLASAGLDVGLDGSGSARLKKGNTLPPLVSTSGIGSAYAYGAGEPPPPLPPPAQRLSGRLPRAVDGSVRLKKVRAPVVSEPAAAANPNLHNLLLEVPYKRGVHTISVNQRYLNHEPTFDPAFELLPAAAAFGTLQTSWLCRFKLQLVNVSNLPQRFTIKGPAGGVVRVVYTPGVAAPGMTVPIDIEVCSSAPIELHEVVTIVTEREEISLPVSATILDADAYAEGTGTRTAGVRVISTEPRDPLLGKTVAPLVSDVGPGTKRFSAPSRDLNYTRPDFFAEPPSDDEADAPPQEP